MSLTIQKNYRIPKGVAEMVGAEAKRRGITETALVIERISEPWGEASPAQGTSSPFLDPPASFSAALELPRPFMPGASQLERKAALEKLIEAPHTAEVALSPYLTACGQLAAGLYAHGKCGFEIADRARWVRRDGKDGKRGDRGGYPICADCESAI